MDGLKGVVPDSCRDGVLEPVQTLFGEELRMAYCDGCQQDNIRLHNGTYCLIRDWGTKNHDTSEQNRKIRFIDLMR